jgi:LmbE family N-acetylglucosaminyl deacetylase
VTPRPEVRGPRVLCVVAHPDDEIAFAGTLYKTTTYLGGACDVLVVTNGEAGFRYSTLSEPLYGAPLTEEPVGRERLPRIRQRELIESCSYLGVRYLFLLGQRDHRYTTDPLEVLAPEAGVWDLNFVRESLRTILAQERYDFVFTLAPTPDTHGHHKAATILALEVLGERSPGERPVAACVVGGAKDESPSPPPTLADFPLTSVQPTPFVFDRTQGFGHEQSLDYRIVANWAIAAHKSQGTMQLFVNAPEVERYYLYTLDDPSAPARADGFFRTLRGAQYPAKAYPVEAAAPTDAF